jgi:hypothetical protein
LSWCHTLNWSFIPPRRVPFGSLSDGLNRLFRDALICGPMH